MAMQIPPGTDLNQIPAGTPPPGVKQELGGGPSLGTTLIVISAILIPITAAVVICRTISSYRAVGPKGGLGWAECEFRKDLLLHGLMMEI